MHIDLFKALALAVLGVALLPACNDDEPLENVLTVEIESPAKNAVISMSQEDHVHVHVNIQATLDLHNITMQIHPLDDHDNIIWKVDSHGDGNAPFTHEEDLSFADYAFQPDTDYVIEVEACGNHQCEGTNKLERANVFTIVP